MDIAERHNHFSGKKNDLFGFIDLVAIGHGETIGVQATSTGNVNARVNKILALDSPKEWLKSGNTILIIGWKKYKKRVDNKLWRPTVKWVVMEDFNV